MTRRRSATLLAWLMGLALLAWSLRQVSWPDLWATLHGLSPQALAWLALLNGLILLVLTARWRVFVQTLPRVPSWTTLFKARLAAFSVSYFTPGPQFGGEPLQVIALHQQGMPVSAATATVTLDKLVELITNFSVLGLGVMALWLVGLGETRARVGASLLALGLLALPLAYMLALMRSHRPLTALARGLAARRPAGRFKHALVVWMESEALAGELARTRPRVFLRALVWAALAWVLMLTEFGLSARWLGAALSPLETLAALAAARFAFLLPMPGGLGALASSQVLVFTALGYDPNAAMALVLYIRARDLTLGVIGAVLAGRIFQG